MSGPVAEGDVWLPPHEGQVLMWTGKEWKSVGLAVVEMQEKALAAARSFQKFAMLPHQVVWNSEVEAWECERCGALSWDAEVIREIDCDQR